VPYTVATDMDSPNPDSGEEYPHTNTQLYNILGEENRFKLGEDITAPWNAPEPGQTPTMDGYVTDYISTFTAEMGRQPTYEEYSQIMTGFTPEQVPMLNGLAGGFGVFDHWFCEVPSQTFMNRSFWTAATSSGMTVNSPATKWLMNNTAETIFNRLEDHGKSWKVYVAEPMQFSATAIIHYPRLKDRLATHFVPFAQFEKDAANGELADFSFIEPCLIVGHGDYHPAAGRAMGHGLDIKGIDPPSSILGGEASCHGSTTPIGGCSPRPGPTSGTRRCSSVGTNPAAPTTTYHRLWFPHRTRLLQRASATSPSTVPATGSQPSSSLPGWPRARCSTTSTGIRR
jgi:phospholipase C